MNAKRFITPMRVNVLASEKLKYLHTQNINVLAPIHARGGFQYICFGKHFIIKSAIGSASFSQMINIPSAESIRYLENGKFISINIPQAEAIVKANEKYVGAKRFITIPTRGIRLNLPATSGNVTRKIILLTENQAYLIIFSISDKHISVREQITDNINPISQNKNGLHKSNNTPAAHILFTLII